MEFRNAINLVPVGLKGKLYISSRTILNHYKNYDIGHLITMFPYENKFKDIRHDIYDIHDSHDDETMIAMNQMLDIIGKDIHDSLNAGINVCVHCAAGISRSATVVLDYLMTYHLKEYNLKDAIYLLRIYRPIVNPNLGFLELLKKRHQV